MNKTKKKKVIVGLSGGVDSSVALILLKKRGFLPIGVSLKYPVWENPKNLLRENICCSKESFEITQKVCQKLNVPYFILDCQKDFREKVMDYFLENLREAKTPNPCIICNCCIKFRKLLEFAKKEKANFIATGHYAKIRENQKTKKYELLKGKDKEKDQSYFLCLLDQEKLAHLILPVGDFTKEEIYQIVKKEGFNFFLERKQSQDLCFVSGKSIPDFLETEIGFQSGDIQDIEGNILGQHQGLHFYTIGQRKGIGLPGGPWRVVDFNREKNILIVSKNPDEPRLYQKEVLISQPNFISGEVPKSPLLIEAKVRYRQNLAKAILYPEKKEDFKLVFDQPQKAVTPGQWAVFYQGEVCLGGGIIKETN